MIDLITYTDRAPGPGETVVGREFRMGFGGKGANQAVMARLLGAAVSMVNCVGDDDYGRMTLANFGSFGIDTTHVEVVTGSSGVAPIWVESDGTNRIIIVPGANHSLTADRAAAAIDTIGRPDVVIGQFEIPQPVTAAAFAAAKRHGAVTILNPAPAHSIDARVLEVTDWLVPNEVEFAIIAGNEPNDDAMTSFVAKTGTRLLVTLGSAGAAVVNREGSVERHAAPAVDAVDTTGAGDAFVGGFAYGLAAGHDESTALRIGIACAADSVTRPGTQTSFPSAARCRELVTEL